MHNRERFFEAFAHQQHRVMGRRLQPLSLRHRFWLEACGSPLVSGGEVNLIDLELASRICAVRSARLDEEVPGLLSRGPRWWEKARFLWWVFRGAASAEYEKLLAYFVDHGCPPTTHHQTVATTDGKVYESFPGILSLVTALIRGSGWEPDTVWRLSPGEAEWYLSGIFLHRGVDMRIKTEHDEEFEEGMLREAERKRVEGLKVAKEESPDL